MGSGDCGAAGSLIGPQRKPVYASATNTPSTTGAQSFEHWYTDVPGVNLSQELQLTMVLQPSGTYAYETGYFFAVDGKLFASEAGDPDQRKYQSDDQVVRNFHFTYALHTTFRYEPGNVFTFRGDDDVFVYINDKLVVNWGGIHSPLEARVALDTGRVEVTVEPQWESLVQLRTDASLGYAESIEGGVAGTVPLDLTPGGGVRDGLLLRGAKLLRVQLPHRDRLRVRGLRNGPNQVG